MEQANLEGGTYSIVSRANVKDYALYSHGLYGKLGLGTFDPDDNYAGMLFYIGPNVDHTYTIFSPTTIAYVGIQEDSIENNATITFFSTLTNIIPLWKIFKNADGDYLLVPNSTNGTNLVLSIPSYPVSLNTPLILAHYYNYNEYGQNAPRHLFFKTWDIYADSLTINNYYDSSFLTNPLLIGLIPEVNNFVADAYDKALGYTVQINDTITPYTTTADECPLGDRQPCSPDICGSVCSDHHKSKHNLGTQVESIPHDNNHVSVLWMDRTDAAYCYGAHSLGGGEVGYYMDGVPIFYITDMKPSSITPGSSEEYEAYEMLMGLLLAHEIAHVYGLEDQYSPDPHAYDPHCRDENGIKIHSCCMERLYYNEDQLAFFNRVQSGEENVFCPPCLELMREFRHIFIRHN